MMVIFLFFAISCWFSLKDEKNLVYAELVLKQSSDEHDGKIPKNTTEYAEIIYKPNADKTTTDTKWAMR